MSEEEELERENQSCDLSDSDHSAKTEEKSAMNPPKTNSLNDQLEKEEERKTSSRSSEGKKDGKYAESDDHEIHLRMERERRKKLRNMYSNLHDLIPHLPSKADKSIIVDEAVNYIKTLENTLQNLQKQKLERLQSVSTFRCEPSVMKSQCQWQPFGSRDQAFMADQGLQSISTYKYEPSMMNSQCQWQPYGSREAFMADQGLQSVSTYRYEPSVMNSQCQCQSYGSREAFIADQGSSSCNNLASTTIATASNPSVPVPLYPVEFQTWTSSNVVLNIYGDEAQFSVCSAKKQGLFTSICYVFEKHKIEVVSAHVSSDNNRSLYMIQAHLNRDSSQLAEAFSVEETFKQAAGEIMLLFS